METDHYNYGIFRREINNKKPAFIKVGFFVRRPAESNRIPHGGTIRLSGGDQSLLVSASRDLRIGDYSIKNNLSMNEEVVFGPTNWDATSPDNHNQYIKAVKYVKRKSSAAWIATEYNPSSSPATAGHYGAGNQSAPSGFYSIGAQEVRVKTTPGIKHR